MSYITLNETNLNTEHICCGFSDKKITESYQMKKTWLRSQFPKGLVFERLEERAKVFLESIPAEDAWVPIKAPEHMFLGCFWVSGKYKKQGHGKSLLKNAEDRARAMGLKGLVTIVGKKKFHFMSDTKWLLKQGFRVSEESPDGFLLIHRDFIPGVAPPRFLPQVHQGAIEEKEGIVVFYSHRCPFTDYHVHTSLKEACEKRKIPLKIHHLKSQEDAKLCPSPATIFSLYYQGNFITTDLSACMDTRLDKYLPERDS
jgi:GNAT superfamily N-acetyltransferase